MDVVPFDASRIDEAAAMYARAFQNDPMWNYVVPDSGKRARVINMLVRSGFEVVGDLGVTHMTPGLEGFAQWLPPEVHPNLGFWREIRGGLNTMPFILGIRSIIKALRVRGDIERKQRNEITTPHWVLSTIAVDPAHQGKGVGSALMRAMLERADAEGKPCHVLTHNANNVPFYEGHGFVVLTTNRVCPGGPMVWTFRRLPRQ